MVSAFVIVYIKLLYTKIGSDGEVYKMKLPIYSITYKK